MKKIATIFFALLVTTLAMAQPQPEGRFEEPVFSDVTVTQNVVYGLNATVLPLPVAMEALPQPLIMDLYEPADDDFGILRPLVLVFHTGNFLPNVLNAQISGTLRDSSAVEICTRLAQHGYVAASVDYRKGWNPLAESQPERALGLIQAAYRGVQDGRTAIRYFKHTVATEDNPYRVDTTRITAFGTGTGGYLVLGMAHLDDYNEIITTQKGPGKFLLSVEPLIPMVVQAYHGDIEGKELAIAPDGAFGYPPGDTSSYINLPQYSSDFQLCMNVGGALGDSSWIGETSVTQLTVQSAFDFFAPYGDETLIVPTTGDPIVRVQGGLVIHQGQSSLGKNQAWIDEAFDDPVTMRAMANSATAGHDYIEGLFPYIQSPNSIGADEGVVIDWWDPDAATPADSPCMGLTWNQCPYPDGSGLTFHEQGLILNEGMSAEKARANIDSIMAFFYPRAYITLDLANVVNVENIQPEVVDLTLSPNPTANDIVLSSGEAYPIRNVRIFDINGRVVRNFEDVNTNFFTTNRGNLPAGMYVVTVEFDEGLATKQLILK